MSPPAQEGEETPLPPVGTRPPLPVDRNRPDRVEEERTLGALGAGPVTWLEGEGLWALSVDPERWPAICRCISEVMHHPLSTLFGEEAHGGIRLHALFLGHDPTPGVHVRCPLHPGVLSAPSLAATIPFVAPFEREVAEMFGVTFLGAMDRRPLLLHERHSAPPLRKGPPATPTGELEPYVFPPVEGEGVYEIPVGPVHAGVIEPGHFRFQAVGEEILDLEVRLGYTHKGTERLFEGQPVARGTLWAESISGDMSVAGGVAYAHAAERALDSRVPAVTEAARGLLLELERIAFLCGDVAGISLDVGYAVGAARANRLRERTYAGLRSLTGSRLGRAIVGVGGFRRPLVLGDPAELILTLRETSARIQALRDHLLDKSSVVDRLQGTGIIHRWTAELLHFLGPTARASGLRIDLRVDRPYGPYRDVEVHVPRGLQGDVQDRLTVKVDEVVEACRLSETFLGRLGQGIPPAPATPPPPGEPREGLGWVESPRGEFLVYLALAPDGTLGRVHVRDPSFLTWPAIEQAVRGNIVPDFPLCNKSLNLSYSGYDR